MPFVARVVAERAGERRTAEEDLAAERLREPAVVVQVDVVDGCEVAAGVEVDQDVAVRDDLLDDRVSELVGEHPVGVAREDPVQVAHVERRVPGERPGTRTGSRPGARTARRRTSPAIELSDKAPDRLHAERLVAVDARDQAERRAVAGARRGSCASQARARGRLRSSRPEPSLSVLQQSFVTSRVGHTAFLQRRGGRARPAAADRAHAADLAPRAPRSRRPRAATPAIKSDESAASVGSWYFCM